MPYEVTRRFEAALCEYTGARYAVAVNSGTAALMLSVQWRIENDPPTRSAGILIPDSINKGVTIPKHTYISVPMALHYAGANVGFWDYGWRGTYEIKPMGVWDSACRFTSGMYRAGQFQCVSFAARKILGAEQGGAILHDNPEADKWFRRMRFDGRTEGVDPKDDTFDLVGHHCIMLPSVAATLLLRLYHLPKHNEDIGGSEDYPDISGHPAWR